MSDQTVRETPTEALEGEGLSSTASMPNDAPASGSAGKFAAGEMNHAGPGDSGKGGAVDSGKFASKKLPPPSPLARVAPRAGAAGAPEKHTALDRPGGTMKTALLPLPPSPRTRPLTTLVLDDGGATLRAAMQGGPSEADAAPSSSSREPASRHAAQDGEPSKASLDDSAPSTDAPARSRALDDEPTVDAPLSAEKAGAGGEGASAAAQEKPRRAEVLVRLFGRTDVGQVREHNEDNFIVADLTRATRGQMDAEHDQPVGERGALLGVCDGMGGAAAGEVASQLAVDIIYQRMSAGGPPKDHDDLAARLVQAIEAAGLRIFSEAKLDRTRRGMGTTSTIAALMDDHLFLGQVGDSRAYILRGDRLVQVTRDQSLVNQLIEAGQLTEEEAETFEHNNIILQALGTADTVQVDLTYVQLKQGDTLMLCSDGLSGMVRNEEIREVLRTVDSPLEACKVLTDRANQAGGHDNITVVVAKFNGEGLAPPTREDIEGLRYQKYQLPEHILAANAAASEPARRVKELDEKKISQRPPSPKAWLNQPDADAGEELEGYHDPGDVPSTAASDRLVRSAVQGDEPIFIPTDGAPQWLVIMMIASAVACVTIAGYYLLR